MPVTVPEMLKMSQAQLDDLFRQGPVGGIPRGEAKGTAIVAPGTTYTQNIANFINHFAWQGKIFDPTKGVLRNKILPLGLNAIIAKVYEGPSWLDNKECIVLDYSETSLLAHWVRDEIREIAPYIYLGKVYLGKKRLIDLALEFPGSALITPGGHRRWREFERQPPGCGARQYRFAISKLGEQPDHVPPADGTPNRFVVTTGHSTPCETKFINSDPLAPATQLTVK